MKKTIFQWAVRASALAVMFVALRCTEDEKQRTSVLLTIESRVAVSRVDIDVRNIGYDDDTISKEMGERDLREDPLVLLILTSSIIQDEFFVHVRGYQGVELVAAAAEIFTFQENQQQEATLVLIGEFNDADGDGFEACNDSDLCDCNDQNPTINPFTVEDCEDFLDNNCSGLPINEGCPCNQDEFCTPLPEEFLDLAGIGMCYFGTLPCVDGELGTACDGGTFNPAGEIPDNLLDDNCNGVVDEDSACTPGQRRRCFLGWVEPFPGEPGADYPPDIQFAFAYDMAGVACVTGEQTCGATGRWENACVGELRPQRPSRPEIGWVELPSNPSEGVCAQCDGLDNDCNGQFDEEPWFDGDRDGYTQCGTNIDTGGDPANPDDKITGMHAGFVDCDDSRADVNPGMAEICGNTVDEDCRCDHDSQDRPPSDPATEIGQPYLQPPDLATCTRPQSACASTAAALNCSRCGPTPDIECARSDANPVGLCSNGPGDCTGCESYYHGYFGANDDCYLCAEQFGYGCSDTSGVCTTQEEDCTVCDASIPAGPTDPSLVRPVCTSAGAGCTVTTPPQWEPIVAADPFDECPAVDCTGHFGEDGTGGSGITNGQCFEKADQTAADVNCNGREICETAALLCPLETDSKQAPEIPPTICQEAVSGCIGTSPPNYSPQTNNNDLFNQCNDNFTCDNTGAGGGPFYHGIDDVSGNDECYLRANIANSSCDGTGACQDRVEACTTAGQGAIVTGTYVRPNCRTPTGGCTDESFPTYSDVTSATDPYNDCPVSAHSAAGGTDLDCYQGGVCYKDLGVACSTDLECQPGWSCVDDVCCSTASCIECHRCDVTGQEGTCQPWTGNTGVSCDDDCSSCVNGTCTPRPAGDFAECTVQCQACLVAGGNCGAWTGAEAFGCTGVDDYCCSGTCVDPTGANSEYGGPCGSGDCAGGTWGCAGTAARCSSHNDPCDYCSGDRWYDAVCTADDGASCNTGTQNNCAVCTSCIDSGITTSCVATGGANSYPAYTDDSTSPNTCSGINTCDGNSGCKLDLAQTCTVGGDCVSSYCTDSTCCTTSTCGQCQRCDQGGGTCQGIVANEGRSCNGPCTRCAGANDCRNRAVGAFSECPTTSDCLACLTVGAATCGSYEGDDGTNCDSASTYCCGGVCVNPAGATSEYGTGCGSGNCSGGSWGCSGTNPRCSSFNDPCDYCSGDTRYDAVCTSGDGATCSTGTSSGCAACTSCRDDGTTTTCVATGGVNNYTLYTDDTTSPNTCSASQTCDGSGNCDLDLGQACTAGGQCASGNCVDSTCCSTSTCGTCERCNQGGGTCQDIVADDGRSCAGPCTYCNGSGCANRAQWAFDECVGECQGCTAAGASGVCGDIVAAASGPSCTSASTYCCNGTCVDPTGGTSELGSSCGSGDCGGGAWGCSGSSPRCSSWGNACDYCSGDTWYNATCWSSDGAACNVGSANSCPACQSCRDDGGSTSCVASGGANNYGVNSIDSNNPNQCRDGVGACGGTDCRCDGAGNCDKAIGESCGAPTECGTSLCVDNFCCATTCGECERCDQGGSEGTCQNITAATGRSCNSASSFCCAGTCVTPGGELSGACGVGDCAGGTWGCNGTAPECSSLSDPCDYCTGDAAYDATCTANFGTTCGVGTPSDCAACTSCVDGGATTSCAATGGVNNYGTAGTDDTDGAQCTGSTGGCGETVCTCDAGNGACLRGDTMPCNNNNQCASNDCTASLCVGP